jgi:hypothetical protein
MNIQTTENLRIFWGVHLALPIGKVLADRNILYRFAYSSRCRLLICFKQKLHVQMANSYRSPQSQTKTQQKGQTLRCFIFNVQHDLEQPVQKHLLLLIF